jgi:hypothetical protein
VYLVIVFFLVILHMLLLSSKLKRNLIVSLNSTERYDVDWLIMLRSSGIVIVHILPLGRKHIRCVSSFHIYFES